MDGVNSLPHAGVGLLAKAFGILDLFQLDQPTWSQSEIVKSSGLNRSTVSRLVRYLRDSGYLVQYEQTGRYALGLAAVNLGRRADSSFDLKTLGQPAMEELSRATDETIILTELSQAARLVTCVNQIEGRHGGLRVFERIGATFPLHAGAAPKAILALLPEMQREAYLNGELEAVTENTPTDPASIRGDLEMTASRGYSISTEETYPGVAGVGAAFRGPDGSPVGSIAIAAPMQRVNSAKLDEYGQMLVASTRRVTALLCGQGTIGNGAH